ncbi:SpoIIE family protein phosphatase [Streptomyces sp. TM32]|uniref:SpoIIE family protein phosphatase n=1 Tax=Streptomyces sp. TM32 TaxID=1652669 RepID=UPI0020B172C6|nr:SpoIIE family protein phosphatase [Streptomyces sp. TM32]
MFSADAWMAAVPLHAPDGALGSLTVLADEPGGPDASQLAFLGEVARWAAGRLHQTRPVTDDVPVAWQETFDAVQVGTWDWDLRTGAVNWNEPALAILGLSETHDRRVETWVALVHPDDLPWVIAEDDQAIRTRDVIAHEYRIRRPDGTIRWVQSRGRVVVEDSGAPTRIRGALWDTTDTHTSHEAVSRALRHMSDAFLAIGRDWRVTFLNVAGEQLFGPSQDVVSQLLWDIPAVQGAPDLRARMRQAAARGSPSEFELRWPQSDRWYHLRLVPALNGLTVYCTDVTDKRLRDAAEQAAAERAARIAELAAALAKAISTHDVVEAVADRILPAFGATGLVIHVLEADQLHAVGAVGYSREFIDRIRTIPLDAGTAVNDALSTVVPKFIDSAAEFRTLYPKTADLATLSGKNAWAFLPLVASGQPIGACVIAFDEPRHLAGEERILLTAISSLVAQALARARLYDAEHTRARQLQRGLLPRILPSLPAVTTAARYLPTGQGVDVGGDWYDVIALSADRVGLVIGDVMGHGLSEAATMGRLRTALHTLSSLELPPDEVLDHLNSIVSGLGDESYATCLYAIYDPTNGTCSAASAGHPPPAIVDPEGTVTFPDWDCNPPLGAAEPPFDTFDLALPEGSLLVLYTDGLIESATRDIDQGMDQLARTLTHAVHHDETETLQHLCDLLTTELLPAGQPTSDDTALLIARTHQLPSDNIASWSLCEDPQAAGQAREHVREQLAHWNLDDLTATTELLISELVGNAIRHAKGPITLRLLHSKTLICEVFDASLTTPRIRHATETDEGGRGLQLVAALSSRWGTRYTTQGKCIWTEQAP